MNVPSFVTSISLGILEEYNNIMSIPVTVKTLKINYDGLRTFSKTPDTIENLYLNRFRYTDETKVECSLTPYNECLPKYLKILMINYYFDANVDNLPKSIVNLFLGDTFNQDVSKLPPKLLTLYLGDRFVNDISKLPESIQCLTLGYGFNNFLGNLPKAVLKLRLCSMIECFKYNLINYCVSKFYFRLNSPNMIISNLPFNLRKLSYNEPRHKLSKKTKIPYGVKICL